MNKRILLMAAALTMATRLFGQSDPNCSAQPVTCKAMRNCFRPVLVFAPDAKDASFIAQQALFERYAGDMTDRNLLYVPVLAQGTRFQKPLYAPYVVLKQSELNAIRSRFRVAPSEFAVVLVGKDGGEKFRSRKPISMLKLDGLVDAMPMGLQEKSARNRKAE